MITAAGSSEPVRLRPLTAADDELLRAATHMNVNWAGQERLTYRDLDTLPDSHTHEVILLGRISGTLTVRRLP